MMSGRQAFYPGAELSPGREATPRKGDPGGLPGKAPDSAGWGPTAHTEHMEAAPWPTTGVTE